MTSPNPKEQTDSAATTSPGTTLSTETADDRRFKKNLSAILFTSRWLQAPLYFGLVIAQVFYVFTFMRELWHVITHITDLSEADMMLMVLAMVDIVMVANLLIMVIVGGYETFVSRVNLQEHPDQPEWLSHVNSNVLKVKLAMAIIGISSVHLLKSFVEAKAIYQSMGPQATQILLVQAAIHMAFILSAMALSWIDQKSR
ncbi:MAG: TIGR00645 family protein [Actinomycetaceae bacterium]|nr:TIGR00645 family protein [Actinomycetaceae bacterium]